MALERLAHYTIRVGPDDLDRSRRFYVEVLGLTEGARPAFSFPGHWLYCGGQPVVHLAGTGGPEGSEPGGTGHLDHVAFHATGLQTMLAHLRDRGIVCQQKPLPSQDRFQVFLTDPNGINIELNYSAEEAREADH
jgi:catechol 2,3-dioxygenase-like lactoylglutathione lyase family enzyme